MAINPEDVKLYESQRLTDEDDGGGRATGNEVVDGTINNLFKDISRLDRTVGDVALRKAFVGVDTNNQDDYLGAHAIIVAPPEDSNVSVVMFDAGSESDLRADAQDRIESYVVQGAFAQWDLQGNQFEGQRSIVGIQREEAQIPEVGDVYFIENPANGDSQYVRITEVESSVQTYTYELNDGSGFVDFDRRRLDLGISAPLNFTFPGGEPRPDGPTSPHSDVFSTEVADAARYWGVTGVADDVNIGDVSVLTNSIYSSLVPSAQAESPIVDAPFYLGETDVRAASDTALTETIVLNYITPTSVLGYLRRAAVRGSVTINIDGSAYVDNGNGILERLSGASQWPELRINYANGQVEGTRASGVGQGTRAGTAAYTPGAPYSGLRQSAATPIDINNRGFIYIDTFPDAKPRPGSLTISFRALGKWYTIKDRGDGVLEGFGSGTVNFTTGTYSATLDALPDVGSEIITQWVMDIVDEVEARNGSLSNNGSLKISASDDEGLQPGTVVVSYVAGGVTYTLDDSANLGVLAGDGVGTVDYGSGEVVFEPDITPDDGTTIDLVYDLFGVGSENFPSPTVAGGSASGVITNAPLKPGTVTLKFNELYEKSGVGGNTAFLERVVRDDGAGGWLGGFAGSIDYTTGAWSVGVESSYERNGIETKSYWDRGLRKRVYQYFPYTQTRTTELSGGIQATFSLASATAQSGSASEQIGTLDFKLFPDFDSLVPGSLVFDFGGKRYFDRDGTIYTDFVSSNGAASAAGSVNYVDATVALDQWPDNAAPGLQIIAAASIQANISVANVSFRTAGAPLRPQSVIVTVTDVDGNVISEAAALDGTITGSGIDGYVNVETGVVDLQFTSGDVEVPEDNVYVYPDTGRYSAVLVSFLPLDAELIGLDPVRLPSDGRVPIFREGDVIVLSNTQDTDGGNPAAGSQIALARDNLAGVEIIGANDYRLDAAQYTANKLTGVITFADPLTLEESPGGNLLTTPLTIRDRVEHMSVVNDVQITGELSFISPTAHEFPAETSVVSSAKVWGDINSRYYNFFTQRTWLGNYVDTRVGDDTTANYNDIDNPIEIANNGAITEKWVIKFTSSTAFEVIGENLGVIATGSTSVDVAPTNPNTGNPYFVMRSAGFGGGWATGNCIRFDTDGCLAPVWISRTVLSGAAEQDDDKFTFQVRGDAD